MGCTPMRGTPLRCTLMRCMSMRFTSVRHAPMRYTPVRCTPMSSSEAIAFWGGSRRGRRFDPENPPKSVALPDAACLRIRIQTLNCSSPFVINLKCFTRCDSDFQMLDLKTFSFPGGEIPTCPYNVPDLDGETGQLLI